MALSAEHVFDHIFFDILGDFARPCPRLCSALPSEKPQRCRIPIRPVDLNHTLRVLPVTANR